MLKKIKLGNVAEIIISIITFGYGEQLALWIANKLFNKNTCGCCERKQWLNRLTNKEYTANCGSIKLF